MFPLVVGALLIFAGLVAFIVRATTPSVASRATAGSLGVLLIVIGCFVFIAGSAVYVPSDQTGIVTRTLGKDLPPGRIVALGEEKGPQARVLGPGWHFGFWPWSYEVEKVGTLEVPNGSIGVVTALDGKVLPSGSVFAPLWTSADDMLDATKFLSGQGYRGPQLTILTPGNYRLNPRLFRVTARPVTLVNAGEVGVVKANAGEIYREGNKIAVNGVDVVPQGFSGIWRAPLAPGAYNLHPDAYQIIKVKTAQRVYTYQHVAKAYDDSITVRSKDGFTFPVDIRLSLSVASENAPLLVALLGDPDRIVKDDQENEQLEILEARLVMPTVRATLRNVAETLGALEFVASRSHVEANTAKILEKEFAQYHLAFQGAFIGAINVDATEAGQALLLTQTAKEVSVNQRSTFQQQELSEQARMKFIRAREEAEQQKPLIEAEYTVKTATEHAKAQIETAKGEAETIKITSEARRQGYEQLASAIGREGVTLLESLRIVREGNIRITPDVVVQGDGSNGTSDVLAATILRQQLKKTDK